MKKVRYRDNDYEVYGSFWHPYGYSCFILWDKESNKFINAETKFCYALEK